MHSRLKSIESGNFFFQPRRLHLQPADLLVQFGDQSILILHLATLVAGEQLHRTVEQLFFPLPDLGRMHAELASQLTDRGTWGYVQLVELAEKCYQLKCTQS